MVEISSRVLFAVVLLVGVVLPGFLDYLLSNAGASQLGAAVWVLGYGTMVIVIWYGWIRPLDLAGPDTTGERIWPVDGDSTEDENSDSAEAEEQTMTPEPPNNGT